MRKIRFILFTGWLLLSALVGLSPTDVTVLVLEEELNSGVIVKGRVKSWDLALGNYDPEYDYSDTIVNNYERKYSYRKFKKTKLSSFNHAVISDEEFNTLFPGQIR